MVGIPLPQRQLPLLLPLLRLMPALPLAWRQVHPAASRLGLFVRLLVPGWALVWVWVVLRAVEQSQSPAIFKPLPVPTYYRRGAA